MRCQVRARPVLRGESRGSIQISGCGNGGEYLASAPVKRGLTQGTRSRRASALVSSADKRASTSKWAQKRDGRQKQDQATVKEAPGKRKLDKRGGGELMEQRRT